MKRRGRYAKAPRAAKSSLAATPLAANPADAAPPKPIKPRTKRTAKKCVIRLDKKEEAVLKLKRLNALDPDNEKFNKFPKSKHIKEAEQMLKELSSIHFCEGRPWYHGCPEGRPPCHCQTKDV